MSPSDPGRLRTVALETLVFTVANNINLGAFEFSPGNLELSTYMNEATRQLVVRLDAFMARGRHESLGGSQVVTYPAGWWEAVKERFGDYRLTRWYTRRYPVKYTRVEVPQRVEIVRVCPHLPLGGGPGRYQHVEFLVEPERQGAYRW